MQPSPCGQRGAQPIGYDIGNLCGPLGHAGLVELIGDAVAERGQEAVEGDLPWGTCWCLVWSARHSNTVPSPKTSAWKTLSLGSQAGQGPALPLDKAVLGRQEAAHRRRGEGKEACSIAPHDEPTPAGHKVWARLRMEYGKTLPHRRFLSPEAFSLPARVHNHHHAPDPVGWTGIPQHSIPQSKRLTASADVRLHQVSDPLSAYIAQAL